MKMRWWEKEGKRHKVGSFWYDVTQKIVFLMPPSSHITSPYGSLQISSFQKRDITSSCPQKARERQERTERKSFALLQFHLSRIIECERASCLLSFRNKQSNEKRVLMTSWDWFHSKGVLICFIIVIIVLSLAFLFR